MHKYQKTDFDPKNPKCPECGSKLRKHSCIDTIRYEEIKATMYVHICTCGTVTGYVVLDEPKADDQYIMGKIF